MGVPLFPSCLSRQVESNLGSGFLSERFHIWRRIIQLLGRGLGWELGLRPRVPWLRNRVETGAAILFVLLLVVYQEPSVCPVNSKVHDKEGGVSVTGQRAEPTAAGQVAGSLLKPWRAATHLRLLRSTIAVPLVRGEQSRRIQEVECRGCWSSGSMLMLLYL